MSEYTDIKQDIDENITTNGRGEITPTKVRFVLKDSMIDGFNVSKADDIIKTSAIPVGGLKPDTFYNLQISQDTDITFAPAPDDGYLHEYLFAVSVTGTPTITLPATITEWYLEIVPDFIQGKTYLISVVQGLGISQVYNND